jgi:hypothetical protein
VKLFDDEQIFTTIESGKWLIKGILWHGIITQEYFPSNELLN